jgi:hypothetical protein
VRCALGVPFPIACSGGRPGAATTDGVWARHWYDRVERLDRLRAATAGESDEPALEGSLAAIEARVVHSTNTCTRIACAPEEKPVLQKFDERNRT